MRTITLKKMQDIGSVYYEPESCIESPFTVGEVIKFITPDESFTTVLDTAVDSCDNCAFNRLSRYARCPRSDNLDPRLLCTFSEESGTYFKSIDDILEEL